MSATANISIPELLNTMVKGMPFDQSKNLALAVLLDRKGIKFERRSLFGLQPPEIIPPFEMWWTDHDNSWTIEQGSRP